MQNNYVYKFGNDLYLNLTNRCTNDCEFCVRRIKNGIGEDDLFLLKEPTIDELKEDLSMYPLKDFNEIVFCGYGEPMCNLSMMTQVGPYLKSKGLKTRLNTNGQGDLINKRETAKIIAKFIDCVSISLNAASAEFYQDICHSKYGEDAYYAVIKFAKDCVALRMDVTLSVVDFIGEEEIEASRKIAEEIGAKFRVRETIYE